MNGAAGHDLGGVTLGLLAGGRATRLGGRDKAWLERDGEPQVLRLARRFGPGAMPLLVSANRGLERYAQAGLAVVADRVVDAGPSGAIDALASACATPWLFTLPVDVVDVDDDLPRTLVDAAHGRGAYGRDDDGPQPLVALWPVAALRDAVARALAAREFAVRALQARMGMAEVRLAGVRFGNLNTPADLAAVGIQG